jgi:hypothetical protein
VVAGLTRRRSRGTTSRRAGRVYRGRPASAGGRWSAVAARTAVRRRGRHGPCRGRSFPSLLSLSLSSPSPALCQFTAVTSIPFNSLQLTSVHPVLIFQMSIVVVGAGVGVRHSRGLHRSCTTTSLWMSFTLSVTCLPFFRHSTGTALKAKRCRLIPHHAHFQRAESRYTARISTKLVRCLSVTLCPTVRP